MSHSHIFGIVLAAMDSGKGFIASFFFQDQGLALSKRRPDQPQAFKEANNGQAFPKQQTQCIALFFLNKPDLGVPRYVGTKFRANI